MPGLIIGGVETHPQVWIDQDHGLVQVGAPSDDSIKVTTTTGESAMLTTPDGPMVVGITSRVLTVLECFNYHDDPRFKLKPGEDMRRRMTRWVRNICLHTTKGITPVVKPGVGPDTDLANRISRLWSTDGRNAGAHISIDHDCRICCHADLLFDAAYHAGSVNEVSIGIELYQGPDGSLYQDQLATCVYLVEWLCAYFGIQRQMPWVRDFYPLGRLAAGAKDFVGVFGHRHVTRDRGRGDPGDPIFMELAAAGFRQFNLPKAEDLSWWRGWQMKHGLRADGVPGPVTRDVLASLGYAHGLYRQGAD